MDFDKVCNYCRKKMLEDFARKSGFFVAEICETEGIGGLGPGYSYHILANRDEEISPGSFMFWVEELPEKCEC